jgi:hypothetical protein
MFNYFSKEKQLRFLNLSSFLCHFNSVFLCFICTASFGPFRMDNDRRKTSKAKSVYTERGVRYIARNPTILVILTTTVVYNRIVRSWNNLPASIQNMILQRYELASRVGWQC